MGPVIAGAGIAARGFTTWLAKKKAREAAARAAVRSTGSASIPNLVTSARPSGLGSFASRLAGGGAAVLGGSEAINAMTQQPNGGDLHPRIESMERLRNPRIGMTGLGGGYMDNPRMDFPSQDPSYDASMTREGQIQTMMEGMDGMNMSEDAKRQIIADKLGVMINGNNADYGGPLGSVEKKKIQDDIDEMKKEFARRNTVDYRRYGASPESIEAMEKKDNEELKRRMMNGFRSGTGAGVTSNEMKMFMGRPVQTSGYDRGPIRPRYDEFGNLIPQRPTMMV